MTASIMVTNYRSIGSTVPGPPFCPSALQHHPDETPVAAHPQSSPLRRPDSEVTGRYRQEEGGVTLDLGVGPRERGPPLDDHLLGGARQRERTAVEAEFDGAGGLWCAALEESGEGEGRPSRLEPVVTRPAGHPVRPPHD